MSLVAEFGVPVGAFCLGETLQTEPSVTVELDRIVAHSPEYVMPFVWMVDGEQGDFEAALATDPTVANAEMTDSFDGASLYQMTWTETVAERLQVILDHDGVLLEAHGSGDGWLFSVRFGSPDHFTEFREHFEAYGSVTLHRLKSPRLPGDLTYGVSRKQREALLTALESGYYDTPGTATGEDLAETLGISQQAVSRRLQRGVCTLLENTLGRHREGVAGP